ncbi:DNA topoisomerase 1 beta-like [Cucurbita maxima]|uniref:DNA topoisomerase I n=1 Tax=Cucurbita maxima TaxID=3661 RepID=A0A6J1L1R3_CUCMA|nr:DNA topoisomerase 1 beta-like [Cucurbita maxima]XP_023005284.1 DNA topoisomerase 1 beta-like [Cucurbita maxima]XP_023005285.1 DNA topoisomerase 1 beta-like [Cucurbita maxima]XP_023005286.1 DNA topoisomerase 1 beta-like [Cucurbita maxima]
MAVETFGKAPTFDEDDEDNMPIVFKRSSASRQNQLDSEAKQRLNKLSGRQGSDVCSANGQTSNAQNRTTSLPKTSPMKSSQVGTQKASNSSIQASLVKSPGTTLKVSDSTDSQSRHLVKAAVKEENDRHPTNESSDSEDDKPLSFRLKGKSNPPGKGLVPTVLKNKVEKSSADSDDEIPLSSKFHMKSSSRVSGGNQHGFDEKKPLISKVHQNGLISGDKLQKPGVISSKRPLPNADSHLPQFSSKKPKLSDSSTPLGSKLVSVKAKQEVDDNDDHIPISQRMKKVAVSANKSLSSKKTVSKVVSSSMKKTFKKSKKPVKKSKYVKSTKLLPSSGDGQKKWTSLVHNGVIFPPPYQTHGVKMIYKGKLVDLTPEQEEVATMFAVMKDTDYMQKPRFKENFWNDWRKLLGKNHVIQNLDDCDFTPIYDWYQTEKEKKKQMTTEEKKALKEEKMKQEEKYMWAILDGVKEKVGNFRVEPPGLFRGRGEHPKMGKLKRRIHPSDITINIGKDAPIPECPIPGERWKEVRHDNTVTWLAFWNDPINPKEFKYVFLAASSSLKGQSDKEKYEKARKLKDYIKNIRNAYTKDFTSKDPTRRQIAVATYLIDKLALRAGNEKDDDEADTVGCCTLKVENVKAVPPNLLEFNFLGKDSIKYENTVEVELPVFKAITQFQSGKSGTDDLFDKLDTSKLNAHLKDLMPGLTAKVFRTYNASITLDDMLNRGTKDGDVAEKIVIYQHANKEVAIICNHQRTVSKSHGAQMSRLNEKISELRDILKELKIDLDRAKKGKPPLKDADGKQKRNLTPEVLEKKISQTNAKIEKIERDMQTKEDLKTVALGTSKINYLDPRITVAWCKRHEVPIEKIFNKSLLAKFAWAMDVDPDFRF